MNRLIILFFIFLSQLSIAGSVDEDVKHLTDSLKSQGVEKVFVHQYSLFNGRYYIPYDYKELRCDNVPKVVHIFWSDKGQWRCLRLDNCGRFNVVSVKNNFKELSIDEKNEFKKNSAHFVKYGLTKLYGDDQTSVYVSETQLKDERNSTTKTFKKVNKIIKQLENNHQFKRV